MRPSVCSIPTQRKQQGFVLVLTLWVLVIVTIAAGYFSERVASAVALAQQSRQNTQAVLDMSGTKAEILYRLGTTTLTEFGAGRGQNSLKLNNRSYHGLGGTVIRLQDNRGLVNLNIVEDIRLQRLLSLLNVPMEQHAHLIATLRDYTDGDKLHLLNGAEEEEYLTQNLPAPPNSSLVTPWELRRIIGWRDLTQLWQTDQIVELTSTTAAFGINPNTAPSEVLQTLPGITKELAQAIIIRREMFPIINAGQLAEMISIPVRQLGDMIAVIPSDSIRITQFTQGFPGTIQYNITLTPNSNEAPWRTDYYNRVSTNHQNEKSADILELPPRSTAPPEAAPF